MAKSSANVTKANRNSQSRTKTAKNGTPTTWLTRFGRTNVIVVAIFVLAFAGTGTYYLRKSSASPLPNPCVYYKLSLYRFSGNACVKNLQYVLQNANFGKTCPTGRCDGVYGPVTQQAVYNMGMRTAHYNNHGVMDKLSWQLWCGFHYSYPTATATDGCGDYHTSRWGTL